MTRFLSLLLAGTVLIGCNAPGRLSEIGRGPQFSEIQNPTESPTWRPISMPMPAPREPVGNPNSLWRPGSRAFFRDQRAAQVGDILTVLVQIRDEAQLENSSTRSRNNSESLGLPAMLGLQSSINRIFPNDVSASNLVQGNSTSGSTGTGQIQRTETVTLRVAATVTQILPNGNFVVAGRQEVRVNNEMRELGVNGVLRPQDIQSDNTVRHDRLAEARIAYVGRGTISDVQQPRYGQQLLDIILPF
jgi:flagellar L-ring protein precursor FlgH